MSLNAHAASAAFSGVQSKPSDAAATVAGGFDSITARFNTTIIALGDECRNLSSIRMRASKDLNSPEVRILPPFTPMRVTQIDGRRACMITYDGTTGWASLSDAQGRELCVKSTSLGIQVAAPTMPPQKESVQQMMRHPGIANVADVCREGMPMASLAGTPPASAQRNSQQAMHLASLAGTPPASAQRNSQQTMHLAAAGDNLTTSTATILSDRGYLRGTTWSAAAGDNLTTSTATILSDRGRLIPRTSTVLVTPPVETRVTIPVTPPVETRVTIPATPPVETRQFMHLASFSDPLGTGQIDCVNRGSNASNASWASYVQASQQLTHSATYANGQVINGPGDNLTISTATILSDSGDLNPRTSTVTIPATPSVEMRGAVPVTPPVEAHVGIHCQQQLKSIVEFEGDAQSRSSLISDLNIIQRLQQAQVAKERADAKVEDLELEFERLTAAGRGTEAALHQPRSQITSMQLQHSSESEAQRDAAQQMQIQPCWSAAAGDNLTMSTATILSDSGYLTPRTSTVPLPATPPVETCGTLPATPPVETCGTIPVTSPVEARGTVLVTPPVETRVTLEATPPVDTCSTVPVTPVETRVTLEATPPVETRVTLTSEEDSRCRESWTMSIPSADAQHHIAYGTKPDLRHMNQMTAKTRTESIHQKAHSSPFLISDVLVNVAPPSSSVAKLDAYQYLDSASVCGAVCGSDATVSQVSIVLNALNLDKDNMTPQKLSVVFEALGIEKKHLSGPELSVVLAALGFGKSGRSRPATPTISYLECQSDAWMEDCIPPCTPPRTVPSTPGTAFRNAMTVPSEFSPYEWVHMSPSNPKQNMSPSNPKVNARFDFPGGPEDVSFR